jgi:hypothetical protein
VKDALLRNEESFRYFPMSEISYRILSKLIASNLIS